MEEGRIAPFATQSFSVSATFILGYTAMNMVLNCDSWLFLRFRLCRISGIYIEWPYSPESLEQLVQLHYREKASWQNEIELG